jgi:hypothetical protein
MGWIEALHEIRAITFSSGRRSVLSNPFKYLMDRCELKFSADNDPM